MHTLTDTAELAAELSAVDGVPLTDALGMAAAHLQRLTHGAGAGTVCVNCGKYGHAAIDCPEPRQPLPGGRTLYVVAADPPAPQPAPEPNPQPPYGPQRPYPLSDTAELAAEISTVDGMALAEARALAQAHLQRVTHGAGPVCTNCGNYGHMAIDCPYPALPLPRPRPRGPKPIVCGALLAEADRVMAEVSYAAERLLAA